MAYIFQIVFELLPAYRAIVALIQTDRLEAIVDSLVSNNLNFVNLLKNCESEEVKRSVNKLEEFVATSRKVSHESENDLPIGVEDEKIPADEFAFNDFQSQETKEQSMEFVYGELLESCMIIFKFLFIFEDFGENLKKEKTEFTKALDMLILFLNNQMPTRTLAFQNGRSAPCLNGRFE